MICRAASFWSTRRPAASVDTNGCSRRRLRRASTGVRSKRFARRRTYARTSAPLTLTTSCTDAPGRASRARSTALRTYAIAPSSSAVGASLRRAMRTSSGSPNESRTSSIAAWRVRPPTATPAMRTPVGSFRGGAGVGLGVVVVVPSSSCPSLVVPVDGWSCPSTSWWSPSSSWSFRSTSSRSTWTCCRSGRSPRRRRRTSRPRAEIRARRGRRTRYASRGKCSPEDPRVVGDDRVHPRGLDPGEQRGRVDRPGDHRDAEGVAAVDRCARDDPVVE